MAARKPRRYNVRDRLGHWVWPRSYGGKRCPHACCQGKRPHPAGFPVLLNSKQVRNSSDHKLRTEYFRNDRNELARRQIERELDRRDAVDRRREAAAARQASRKLDRGVALEARRRAAERATNGYMVNARGRAIGVSDTRVLTSRRDAEKYGTDELRAFLDAEARGRRRETAGAAEKRRPAATRRGASPSITDADSYLNPNHRLNRRLAARRNR